MKRTAFIFCCFIHFTFTSFAQTDIFSGTWLMEGKEDVTNVLFSIELQIAAPEREILFPAQLKIQYDDFTSVYELLLVKKNNGQLAIGRNKFALKEAPFSIGTWTLLLNGTFDFSITSAGNSVLTAHRIPSKRFGIPLPALLSYDENYRTTVIQLSNFLKQAPIHLQKINQQAWRSADINKILYTYEAPTYFGIIDTLYTKSASAMLSFSENNKADNDSVSVLLNGKLIIDKMDINKPYTPQEITWDTGLNILCFFADNYGKVPPNTAKLNIVFPEKKFKLDFTSKENLSATFMVAKIYYNPNQQQQTPAEIIARKTITEKIKQRQTKLIDSIKAEAQEITLALWDDAVEDGDSISLQINDEIFMPGISVKKKPQFIKVSLYPGENKIIFIADNLGSIPPNTSILEIIDGKHRKSYMIDTNLGQNNAIKIIYDFKPEEKRSF
jgi:hypothetical protein